VKKYSILSEYPAEYPAILDITTSLSLNKLFGRVALRLHPRAHPDFFDTLVALGFLERDGEGPTA